MRRAKLTKTSRRITAMTITTPRQPATKADGIRPLLTVPQVANELQISARTVWRWVASGALPCVRLGRTVRIHPDALSAVKRGGI
jgi:excisionase family DNA binding protein